MQKALRPHCNLQIILSTWKKWGKKSGGTLTRAQLPRLIGCDAAQVIPDRWGNESIFEKIGGLRDFIAADDDRTVTEHEIKSVLGTDTIIDIEEELLDLSFGVEYDPNVLRLTYKIWRANSLKRATERKNRRQFDIVIRTRPDILVNRVEEFLFSSTGNQIGVLSQDRNWINDVFYIGESEGLDRVCNFYHSVATCNITKWKGVHTELASFFNDSGLIPKSIDTTYEFVGDVPMPPEQVLKGIEETAENSDDEAEVAELVVVSHALRFVSATSVNLEAIDRYAAPIFRENIVDTNEGFLTVLANRYLAAGQWQNSLLAAATATSGEVFWSRSSVHVPIREILLRLSEYHGHISPEYVSNLPSCNASLRDFSNRYQRVNGQLSAGLQQFLNGSDELNDAFSEISQATWSKSKVDALDSFEVHRSKLGDFHKYWSLRYNVFRLAGDYENALDDIRIARRLAPDRLSYRVSEAALLVELGHPQDAEYEIRKVLVTWPHHEAALAIARRLQAGV
ncbi:tetratricopeptide repeat protein [Methylobacterium radiotolerans]